MESDTPQIDALSKRIAHLRKAYAKGLGRKASTLEAAAILRAATLSAEAELALLDPSVSLNDKTRIDGAAARARRDMAAVLQATKTDATKPQTLQDYVRSRRAEASA